MNPTLMPTSLSFPPVCPTVTVPPTKIADDTWVIHQVQEALGQPLEIYLNSMVILGAEPVIVDTGTPANRKQWLEDVFSLVEPEDVRWIFLSHDDVDHTGNLDEALTACPNATLVCNWAMVERHTNCFEFPLHRCRWVMDGESFDVGDRTLHAIRPPVFDSPTTRGLYDPTTQVYWAVDTFATPLPDASDGHRRSRSRVLGLRADAVRAGRGEPVDHDDRPGEVRQARRPGAGPRHHDDRGLPQPGHRGSLHRQGVRPDPPALHARPAPSCPDQSILEEIVAATAQAPA